MLYVLPIRSDHSSKLWNRTTDQDPSMSNDEASHVILQPPSGEADFLTTPRIIRPTVRLPYFMSCIFLVHITNPRFDGIKYSNIIDIRTCKCNVLYISVIFLKLRIIQSRDMRHWSLPCIRIWYGN